MLTVPDDRFGTINKWLGQNLPRYCLRHCHYGTELLDAWVVEQKEHIFISIICGIDSVGDEIEHAITVDTGAQIIIDSCEPTELDMNWSVRQKCVGNIRYNCAIDVRHLYRNEVGKNKRKDPRKSKRNVTEHQLQKKKARREMARHLALHHLLMK